MTAINQTVRWSPYGAFELKRAYQKNMALATLSVFLLLVLVILVVAVIRALSADEIVEGPVRIIRSISELGPPPSLASRPPQIQVTQAIAPPSFALPEAVPDEEVVEDFVVVSQEQLADISSPVVSEEGTGRIVVDIPLEDYYPTPDEFVPYEDLPVAINLVQPAYPEMAKKAGIEGSVWVKVLVDKNGDVRDALIYKESGAKAGFEEAAVEAAKKGKWKPALQNKQPVAVWVAYEIKFRLK